MLKKCVCTLGFFLAISLTTTTFGANFTVLTEPTLATVTEIVDSNSLIAVSNDTGEWLRVRLIAIDSTGYDHTMPYLNNILLGRSVYVYPDDSYHNPVGRWNLAYIDSEGTLINRAILSTGHGQIDNNHFFAREFPLLQSAERQAQSRRFGLWRNPGAINGVRADNAVNINTATASVLRNRLNISSSIANEIIEYRSHNPFNTVEEIKFVPGFTKALYDEHIDTITVISNINAATRDELLTLGDLNDSEIDRIISHRNSDGFNNVSELDTERLIRRTQYNQIVDFISTSDEFEIQLRIPNRTFNVNTATASELRGLNISNANTILRYRSNYSYKTLGELVALNALTTRELNRVADNLISGLENEEYININTATRQELLSLGIPIADVNSILSEQGRMTNSERIPINLSHWDSQISLYTNINTASSKELLSLSENMTDSIVSQIVNYRDEQIFGDTNEIRDFFSNINQSNIFNSVRNFLVVR